jgi:hypothetical protein
MIDSIKRFFGITPSIYELPYEKRLFITMLSTSVERVK